MSSGKFADSFVPWSTCDDCGKRAYESRKDAKKVVRRVRSGTRRMHAYQCKTNGVWHVGHVPTLIKDGRVGRRDYGGRS